MGVAVKGSCNQEYNGIIKQELVFDRQRMYNIKVRSFIDGKNVTHMVKYCKLFYFA